MRLGATEPIQAGNLLPARMLNEYAYCPRLFYLEWVQGLQGYWWKRNEVNNRLADIMTASFSQVMTIAKERKVSLRLAAYIKAMTRVAKAIELRGVFP